MGWWKKLKKKISMKNFMKGVKKATSFIPGGNLIREGIKAAEGAYKELKGKGKGKGKTKAGEIPQVTVTQTRDLDGIKKLAPIGLGATLLWFLTK